MKAADYFELRKAGLVEDRFKKTEMASKEEIDQWFAERLVTDSDAFAEGFKNFGTRLAIGSAVIWLLLSIF